jgi:hypothetical protein
MEVLFRPGEVDVVSGLIGEGFNRVKVIFEGVKIFNKVTFL